MHQNNDLSLFVSQLQPDPVLPGSLGSSTWSLKSGAHDPVALLQSRVRREAAACDASAIAAPDDVGLTQIDDGGPRLG